MAERKSTTIEFYDNLQPIKDKLFAIHGLKDSVSAAIFLMNQLTIEDQVKLVLYVKGKTKNPFDVYEDRRRLLKIKKIVDHRAETLHTGGIALDNKLLSELNKIIGDPQRPANADWEKSESKTVMPANVEVQLMPSKLDDFKKVAGPDAVGDDMKTVVENAEAQSVKPGRKKPGGKAKHA